MRRPGIRHRERTGLLSERERGVLRRYRGRGHPAMSPRPGREADGAHGVGGGSGSGGFSRRNDHRRCRKALQCPLAGRPDQRLRPRRQDRGSHSLPANNVTSCAFGGEDGSLLFVTGAALEDGAGPEAPHGDVFVLSGGAKGRPEPAFDPALLGERGTRTPSMGKEHSAIAPPPMRAAPSPPGASP